MNKKGLNTKFVFCLLLALSIILSVIYYAKCYITNSGLIFTESDKFILLLFGGSVILIAVLFIILIIIVLKVRNNISIILEELADVEDNTIEYQRITQQMIMKLSKDLGVGNHKTFK